MVHSMIISPVSRVLDFAGNLRAQKLNKSQPPLFTYADKEGSDGVNRREEVFLSRNSERLPPSSSCCP